MSVNETVRTLLDQAVAQGQSIPSLQQLRASMKMERTSVEPSRLTTLDFSENGTTA